MQRCLGADIFTCNSALHVAGISQPKGKKEKDKICMKRKFNQLVSAGESFILIKRQKNKDKFDTIYITTLTAGSVCQRKINTTRLGKMSFHFDQLEHCEFIYTYMYQSKYHYNDGWCLKFIISQGSIVYSYIQSTGFVKLS